jgi:hypothetical protein
MRTISILSLALIVLLNSCKDDDPKFASAEGDWTYTTSDGKLSVDFTLAKDGATWSVKNQVIRVEGVQGVAAVQSDGINPPSIQYIRINANDVKLTYAYDITFTNATVDGDFTHISVPDATYTWPHDKTNTISDITITRK